MPPKIRISREMIIRAAFDIARAEGAQGISARAVAQKLGCSTQPVMYQFASIDELKRAVYAHADAFHSQYLMDVREGEPLLGIGLNYIRFAIDEPHLFRFLFQSGYIEARSMRDMMDSEELEPLIAAMCSASGLTLSQMKDVFMTIAMFAHGYASIIANNSLAYDSSAVARDLKRAYRGAMLAALEERP